MPRRPDTPCKHSGCGKLVPYGQRYCDAHKTQHPEENRPADQRGYNSRWRKASKEFLRAHPLCEICRKKSPPKFTKATVVDHIVPHRGDQELFWDRSNWQSLCKPCHDRKSMTEDRYRIYEY